MMTLEIIDRLEAARKTYMTPEGPLLHCGRVDDILRPLIEALTHASPAPAAVIAFDASDSDHSDLPLDDWQKEAIKRHAARQAKKGESE